MNGQRPALSATGRYVAFITADKLSPGDANSIDDAYRKDLQTGTVTLASDGAARGALEVDISDDGARVAYITFLGGVREALVLDLGSGQLINATRGPSNLAPDSAVAGLSMSGDGRAVAFHSQATTLLPGTDPGHDVFVKRLDTGVLELASASEGGQPGNASSLNASLSADGRRVAFVSSATNLSPDDTDTAQDTYLKNLDTGGIQVAQYIDRNATEVSLNADGSKAVFGSLLPPTNAPGHLTYHDFATGQRKTVEIAPCTGGGRAKIDGSGTRFAVVCSNGQVLFKEHTTGTVLSLQPANSLGVAVSADGNAWAWDDVQATSRPIRAQRLTNSDSTPPVIAYTLNPSTPDGRNGWYTGDVTLTWQVSDPESTPTLTGCSDTVVTTDQQATTYSCAAASDGGGTGPVSVVIKRDASQPSLQGAVQPASPDGNAGWYVTAPTISFDCDDATSGVDTCPADVLASEGVSTVQGQALDNAGNSSQPLSYDFSVDLTDPTVACGAMPTFLLRQPNAAVPGTVSDGGSGPASATASSPADTSTAGVGNKPVIGHDIAGRSGSATCGYRVAYGFSGFHSPVDEGVVNVGKAGKAVPLKWRAVDFAGAPITNLSSVHLSVLGRTCDLGATQDQLEEFATGASGVQNLGNGNYQINWATPASYASSCKTLRLDQGDGILHTAEFRFTK
ncbi:MAG: PxKF domain-containing protein [Actinomycetes bacterium]